MRAVAHPHTLGSHRIAGQSERYELRPSDKMRFGEKEKKIFEKRKQLPMADLKKVKIIYYNGTQIKLLDAALEALRLFLNNDIV